MNIKFHGVSWHRGRYELEWVKPNNFCLSVTCQKQFCDELTFKSKWWCKQCDWPLLPLSISLCTNVYHEAIHRMKELLEHSTEGILVEGLCVCEMVTGAEAHQGAWDTEDPRLLKQTVERELRMITCWRHRTRVCALSILSICRVRFRVSLIISPKSL